MKMNLPNLRPRAFTLTEMMVTIGIIVVLITILIPVVSKVRKAAYAASTQQEITTLSNDIEQYYQVYHSYPGPLSNDDASLGAGKTMSENLVLGLLGGLRATPSIIFDPTQVGLGPLSLNTTGTPSRHPPFADTNNLSAGSYTDDGGPANDSAIPEFLDMFPRTLPILYLRAKVGASPNTLTPSTTVNNVITSGGGRVGQYDLSQIIGYTNTTIGTGVPHGLKTVDPSKSLVQTPPTGYTYQYPYDAYPYFVSPSVTPPASPTAITATDQQPYPRQKDAYILISAGPDRIYGTNDDISNFGSVAP